MLDVLEGRGDKPVLDEVARLLRPDGILLVTAAGHSRVTSQGDLIHRRDELRRHLVSNGFNVLWVSHVFGWVLPATVIGRNSSFSASSLSAAGADPTPVTFIGDRLALLLTRLEVSIIRRSTLPIGASIICVAVPRDAAPRAQGVRRMAHSSA